MNIVCWMMTRSGFCLRLGRLGGYMLCDARVEIRILCLGWWLALKMGPTLLLMSDIELHGWICGKGISKTSKSITCAIFFVNGILDDRSPLRCDLHWTRYGKFNRRDGEVTKWSTISGNSDCSRGVSIIRRIQAYADIVSTIFSLVKWIANHPERGIMRVTQRLWQYLPCTMKYGLRINQEGNPCEPRT